MSALYESVSETPVEYEDYLLHSGLESSSECLTKCQEKPDATEAVECVVRCAVDPDNLGLNDFKILQCSDKCLSKHQNNANKAVKCVMSSCLLKSEGMEQKNYGYNGYSLF